MNDAHADDLEYFHNVLGCSSHTQGDSVEITFVGAEPVTVMRLVDRQKLQVHFIARTLTDEQPKNEALIFTFRVDTGEDLAQVHHSLAILAASPQLEGLTFVHNAIVNLSASLWKESLFTSVLVCEKASNNEEITLYQLTPISELEAAFVRIHSAEELHNIWNNNKIDPYDPHRVVKNVQLHD